jgi:hypothetical protein
VENDIVLAALGAALTLCIFSYLLGDNPLYRLALHIFVGVSVAYICIVVLHTILLPALTPPDTMDSGLRLLWMISLIGIVLGALLLTRGIRGLAWLSDLSVAILLGVGVGVALGGAIVGTLVPQVEAATSYTVAAPSVAPDLLKPVGQIVAIVGTVTGLMVFSFSGRRPLRRSLNRLMNGGARIGRWFILIGLGAAYGGVLVASLAFFADRVQYLVDVLEKISGG